MKAEMEGKTNNTFVYMPQVEDLEWEIQRVSNLRRNDFLNKIVLPLGAASALAVLIAILLLPILRIYGTSMTPTLYEHNIVISVKSSTYEPGDVVSFYYNNSILVKRAIAFAGDWVDMDEDGNVYVNGVLLDEPYVDEPSRGLCDIELPYQVPDGKIFVLGDHRATSKDSRSSDIGCIDRDKFVGRIVYRIWPLNLMGTVK